MSIAPKMTEVEIVRRQLAEHETEMRRCWQEFARRLAIIRSQRLYEADFESFEEYCQIRWGIRRDMADKQIAAAGIASDLHTIVWIPNEGTAREFVSVPKEDRPKVAEVAKEVAKEKGRDTINSRDVKEAKAKVYKVETTVEEIPPTVGAEPVDIEPPAPELTEADDEEAWLASLPLRPMLQGVPLRRFEEAALTWLAFEAPIKSLAMQIRSFHKDIKSQWKSRFHVRQLASFVIDEPKHWLLCKECNGTGQVPKIGNCSSCSGDGFHASSYKGR